MVASRSTGSTFTADLHSLPSDWRRELHRLTALSLPLLPCGAGKEKKGPIDPATGYGLEGWQSAAFTVAQILAMNGAVRSVGSRTGAGLQALDIDGATALELCLAQGCDPQQARTWQVHRDTDPCRLKVLWRLTPEQQQELGEVSKKAQTKEPTRNEAGEVLDKGEAVEVFHHNGRQVLLLGQHVPSGGRYLWPDGCGPEALALIPPAWWELVRAIAAGNLGIKPQAAKKVSPRSSSRSSSGWRAVDPCPICGRNTTAYCSRNTSSGTIRCFHGNTFSPEISHGALVRGGKVQGTDGVLYGYAGTATQRNGDVFSKFVVHKEPCGRAAAADNRPADVEVQQQPQVLTAEQVRERLAAAISNGSSHTDLAALVADLAVSSGLAPIGVQKIAEAIAAEQDQAVAIKAEAATLAAEADRKEIGQALTLDYLLPPAIAHALRVRCLELPTDDVAAAITYLVTLSGLVKLGTRVVASQAADYKVPINLYAALVARSGAKKSPVSRLLVNAPTQDLRRELTEQHDRAMRDWQESCKGKKPAERDPDPRALYLQVSDATAEALATQLQQQEAKGLGLLLHRDELAGLFGNFNAYRNGRGADQELMLEAYDGSGFSSLRVTSAGGGRFYDRCHLSIWGTIQPTILEKLVADGDASGLWARFLFVPLPERVVPLADHETEAEQRAAADAAQTLADTARKVYTLPKAEHHLDAAARAAFNRYEARSQADALRAAIPAQSALYGKAAGKVLRVAGLLHLLAKVAGEGETAISAATIERATALVDHLNGWALSFHADLAGGGTSDLMRKVHRIALEAAAPIRWKDVSPRLSKKERKEIDCAAVAAAMEALAGLGVGEVERGARGAAVYRALCPLP